MSTIVSPELNQESAINEVLNSTTKPIYLLSPSPEIVSMVVGSMTAHPSPPTFHILGREPDLHKIRRQFSTASLASDLIADGELTLTASCPTGRGMLAVTDTTIYPIAHVEGQLFVCNISDDPGGLRETCETIQGTERFDLRTPGWTRTVETLDETFSPAVRKDFTTAVTKTASIGKEATVDEVVIALLIAAKHELLLYNISRWGDDIQLCSQATFSRIKGKLEDHEVIETTKVPVDVGRPRLRLRLAEPYSSLSTSELIKKISITVAD